MRAEACLGSCCAHSVYQSPVLCSILVQLLTPPAPCAFWPAAQPAWCALRGARSKAVATRRACPGKFALQCLAPLLDPGLPTLSPCPGSASLCPSGILKGGLHNQQQTVVLMRCCSIAGFYMPDNVGGSNVSLPANGNSCLPCPVRATLLWLPLRHALLAALLQMADGGFSPQALLLFAFCRSTRTNPILAKRRACSALRAAAPRTLATPPASLAHRATTHPTHVSTSERAQRSWLCCMPPLPCCLVLLALQPTEEHLPPTYAPLCSAATTCVPAPKGTYVAGTGASMYTPW